MDAERATAAKIGEPEFVIDDVRQPWGLRLSGELDMLTAPLVRAAVERCRSSAAETSITIDATGVTFLDCAGLRPLFDARLAGYLIIDPRSVPVERVLQLTRFDELTAGGGSIT